jgi:hypothetical protein
MPTNKSVKNGAKPELTRRYPGFRRLTVLSA